MAILVVALTILTGILLGAEKASDFAPMRGLMFLCQMGAVAIRELLMVALIARATSGTQKWFVAVYAVLAVIAFCSLGTSGQRHPNMPEPLAAGAHVVAFAIPLLALALIYWRPTGLWIALLAISLLGVVIAGFFLRDLFTDGRPEVPALAISEADLIRMLDDPEPTGPLHAFDIIRSAPMEYPKAVQRAASRAMENLSRSISPSSAKLYLTRANWAGSVMGASVCPGLRKLIQAAEPYPGVEEELAKARRTCPD